MKAQESGQNRKHATWQNAEGVMPGSLLLNFAITEPVMADRIPQAQRKCACGGQCLACGTSHGTRRSISHLSVPPVLQGNGVSSTGGNAFVQQLRNIAAPRHREKVNQHTLPQLWSRMGMGSRIPQSQRVPFENSYGYDFSGVRLHRGSMADRVTRALGVPAVSLGPHIILNRQVDNLPPERSRHVLGHELAHIGQRAAMPVQSLSPAAYSDISISPFNSRSEVEASAASRAAMLGSYNLQGSGVQTDMLYALEYAGMQSKPRELLIRRWAGIRTP